LRVSDKKGGEKREEGEDKLIPKPVNMKNKEKREGTLLKRKKNILLSNSTSRRNLQNSKDSMIPEGDLRKGKLFATAD